MTTTAPRSTGTRYELHRRIDAVAAAKPKRKPAQQAEPADEPVVDEQEPGVDSDLDGDELAELQDDAEF